MKRSNTSPMSKPTSVEDWLIKELFGKDGLVEPDGSVVMNMIRSAQDKQLARVSAKINRLITEAQIRELQIFRRRDFKFDETYDYVLNRMKELGDSNG